MCFSSYILQTVACIDCSHVCPWRQDGRAVPSSDRHVLDYTDTCSPLKGRGGVDKISVFFLSFTCVPS